MALGVGVVGGMALGVSVDRCVVLCVGVVEGVAPSVTGCEDCCRYGY